MAIKPDAPIGTIRLDQTFWSNKTPPAGKQNGGQSFKIRVWPTNPTITGISPNSGNIAGGTSVTITGTGFATGAGVTIGGVTCGSVVVESPTSITCTTGARTAGTGLNVVVTNSDTGSGTGTALFSYTAVINPTVASISPNSGTTLGGTSVTIIGTGFVSGASVSIGGQACTSVTVVSSTSITCVSPAGSSGAKNVVVTNSNTGTGVGSGLFTFIEFPTFSSISPTSGTTGGGTLVTISGSGFTEGATITLGGVPCSPVVVASSTSITCITGAASAGSQDLVITNLDSGTTTAYGVFRFNIPAPAPTPPNHYLTLKPNGGQGTSLTIGSNSPSTLPLNTFKKVGFVFSGWNTKADGSGVAIGDQALYSFSSDSVLFAQWTFAKSKKLISNFAGNKHAITGVMKQAIAKWVKSLPSGASIICQGSTAGVKITASDKKLASKRANNVCKYALTIRSDLKYSITLNPSSATKVAARHVWMYFN